MEEVASEFAGRASFYKVDIEDAEEVAAGFQVWAVPTILFFRGGQPVDKLMGLVPKQKLASRVESLVTGD